jgi:hypothetical protein
VVRRLTRSSTWLCVGWLVTACAILPAQEAPQAVDHPSQAEVVARVGLPESIVAGSEGQTLWIYTVRSPVGDIVVTSSPWVVPGGWRCTQYLLRFDRMQRLRGWTARRC